jgi:hypothetical protein
LKLGIPSLETCFHIKLVGRKRLYIFTFICSYNMPLDLLFENVDKLCADLLIVRVSDLFSEGW